MDELALHKGHRYATVAAYAETLQVVWIGCASTKPPAT